MNNAKTSIFPSFAVSIAIHLLAICVLSILFQQRFETNSNSKKIFWIESASSHVAKKVAKPSLIRSKIAAPTDTSATDNTSTYINHLRNQNTLPPYPRSARLRQEQGTVLVSVEMQPPNQIIRLALKKSSGYGDLDESALAALRSWTFPEVAVPLQFIVPIEYVLDR